MAAHGEGWLDDPRNVKKLLRAFYVLCGVVLVAEFAIHKHGEHPWEELPFFHGAYGFLAIVVLVFLSIGLRKLVLRPPDYYGAADVDPAAPSASGDEGKEERTPHG